MQIVSLEIMELHQRGRRRQQRSLLGNDFSKVRFLSLTNQLR